MLNKTAIAFGIALALSAASPASAAYTDGWDPWIGGTAESGYSYGYDNRGVDAFAQAPFAARVDRNGVSVRAVYPDGTIIGHDPDPNVRNQLLDDYPFLTD